MDFRPGSVKGGPSGVKREAFKGEDTLLNWWGSDIGRLLEDRIAAILPTWLERLRPRQILQLGHPLFWARPPGVADWVLLSDTGRLAAPAYLQVRGDYLELPFGPMTFDLVLAPFCLSRVTDYARFLAECWRVLRPEGHLLILDFNPTGGIALLRRWRLLRQDAAWPWRRPFLPLGRVRSLLEEEDFSLREGRYFQYALPWRKRAQGSRWLELVGDRWWPAGANAYLLLAQRRELRLTPGEPLWQQYLRKAGKGAVPVPRLPAACPRQGTLRGH